ncbi:MAG: hypothetical protein AAF404_04200 [Pseudomonadota bacterium]
MKKIFMTTLLATAIAGCGSADTDTADQGLSIGAASGASGAGGAIVTPPSAPANSTQTADLQASVQFDFATSWDMDINFALPLTNTYMSLCTDYTKMDDGSVDVRFDSCIVRAPITDGQYSSQDVPMTNATESLIAVLIDYANPSTPMYTEFTVQPGKESLDWSEGVSL